MMTLNTFYEQLNQANNIIKNIKMPNDYNKPKLLNSKEIYFPSDIMANILSYLPTPLDHHKKKMKFVNEDFDLIKSNEFWRNGSLYGWNLIPPCRSGTRNLLKIWTQWIKDKRITLKREEELELIQPKLDIIINKLKTKKNIINYLESRGIEIDSYMKREKKDELIRQIKLHMRAVFKFPYLERNSIRKPIEDFLYSL